MKTQTRLSNSTNQKSANALREGERITDRYRLANMTKWATFCAERMTYREIEKMAGKSAPWWHLVVDKKWKKIKPTPAEYRAIKLVYDAVVKFGGDTSGRRDLAYKILSDLGTLQRDIAELMRKV